ncbi:aldehyde dehydrogenase family 3 member F1-like [Lycium ferocissimum]|uniref:aldehyde dehydrogenase family 3 member F1-like n=1 Tax=Lycium ferocissimum TaxID=112874 RepID=UPI0028152761|nr:aldehyde dehydrogenase family 3 member F1-like [Lycium ferocissimum]
MLTQLLAAQAQCQESGSSSGNNGESSKTKDFLRMNPPIFTETKKDEDPQDYINALQKISRIMIVTEIEAATFETHQLQSVANTWYESWELSQGEDAPDATWDEFTSTFLDHFMPIEVREAKAEQFLKLKQNGRSVQDYYLEFISLAKHAPNMVPDMRARVRRFVGGLDSHLYDGANIAAQNGGMTISKMVAFVQGNETRLKEEEALQKEKDKEFNKRVKSNGQSAIEDGYYKESDSIYSLNIGVSLEPLIGAIAAGNVMVLKPSELAPACSSVLAKTIPTYLDSKAIKVIEGDYSVGQKLLQQKWDKIFFTGSTKVAQIVMAAAAKHLTPVTLELGGKCPAIIDSLCSSWDKNIAMKRILSGKFGTCAGQVCAGIDYILVKKTFASELVQMIKLAIPKMFGENPKESHSMSRIVNKTHFLRIKNLLDEPMVKASIIYGGSTDEDNLYIEPTLLLDPPVQAAIMTEEIFGPLLPILTMDNIEDSIEFINAKPKPLAIYAFTKDEELKRKIISRTSSGSVVFNDTIIQYAADTLPFGGVGQSGFGRYHGKFSFDTFSHEKVVVRRSFLTDIWFRYPPWNDHKLQLFRFGFRYDYLSIVLIALGLKKA